jgi:putative hydrolase of the HAD superfamily
MRHPFDQLKELAPIPTGEIENTERIPGIKSVVFDIYGTLIISASGDIGCQSLRGNIALQSFKNTGIHWSSPHDLEETVLGEAIIKAYEKQILSSHEISKSEKKYPHPEVDIVLIWEKVIEQVSKECQISFSSSEGSNIDHERLAMEFEVENNAVYPMPHMEKVLSQLNQGGFELGIVSNAQFFTPMVLNHFMSRDIDSPLAYFNPELQVYSYQLGRAKPDPFLYEELAKKLKKINLVPEQCLYIGNDMLNDIYPAHLLGFKTALYAGDQRSLRRRENDSRCQSLTPDRVITSLDQIFTIIS